MKFVIDRIQEKCELGEKGWKQSYRQEITETVEADSYEFVGDWIGIVFRKKVAAKSDSPRLVCFYPLSSIISVRLLSE